MKIREILLVGVFALIVQAAAGCTNINHLVAVPIEARERVFEPVFTTCDMAPCAVNALQITKTNTLIVYTAVDARLYAAVLNRDGKLARATIEVKEAVLSPDGRWLLVTEVNGSVERRVFDLTRPSDPGSAWAPDTSETTGQYRQVESAFGVNHPMKTLWLDPEHAGACEDHNEAIDVYKTHRPGGAAARCLRAHYGQVVGW